jgi:hypothetical protein
LLGEFLWRTIAVALELVRALAATERNDDYHIARLLIMMRAHSRGAEKNKSIEGLTKLARMDFLLRYPNSLERALIAANRPKSEGKIQKWERSTIESKMVRFRYGPWDHRYRRWVSLMAAKGFITVGVIGKTVHLWLTESGRNVADSLAETEAFRMLSFRADVVDKRFGTKSGSNLRDFIYKTFPELLTMKWGEEIVI